MKNPWIFPALALVVGAVGGYLSGKTTSPASVAEHAGVEKNTRRTRSPNRVDSPAVEPSGKRAIRPTGTEAISRMPGNSDRIKALLEFYANLTPEQLAEEARKLEDLPMNERIMASLLLLSLIHI